MKITNTQVELDKIQAKVTLRITGLVLNSILGGIALVGIFWGRESVLLLGISVLFITMLLGYLVIVSKLN